MTVPSACAIGDELSFRAERALGQPLASAAPVRCTLHIARSAGTYTARMEVAAIGSARPARLRTFSAPSCEQLTETLAFAVVLAIGAAEEELSANAPAVPAAAAAPAVPAAQVDSPPAVDEPAGNSAAGLGVVARAAVVGDAGTLPGVGLGLELAAALGWKRAALRLNGTYLPERRANIDSSASAAIGLLAGGLSACLPALARSGALQLGACAGGELGWLEGTGRGLDIDRTGGSLWGAVRADATARWALGSGLGLDLALSGLIPVERDEFAIAGVGRVHRPGSVVGRASVGLTLELNAFTGSGE